MHRAAIFVSSALAATLAATSPLSANAASGPSIRTYTETASMSFTGPGRFYDDVTEAEKVTLQPALAVSSFTANKYNEHGFHEQITQFDIVGGISYTRSNDKGAWTKQRLSRSALAANGRTLDPLDSLAKFKAIPGVHPAGTGHYTVTASFADVLPFLSFEYDVQASDFQGMNLRQLTANMWLDGSGRPVKFTVTGRAGNQSFSVTENFANYDAPVTITAP
jgi:hypothetical protein